MSEQSRTRAAAFMALGTAVSRSTGLMRSACIVWVLGTGLQADIFENANSIPNALYILIAGGVVNVVLVPHLIRNIRQSADDGAAYTSRVFTLVFAVLGVGTAVALVFVPMLMHIVFAPNLFEPEFSEQRQAALLLMYFCIPQIAFYGAFVLVGQALNARERFGPMMWVPALNNLVAVVVFTTYAIVFSRHESTGAFTEGEIALLGIGSTVGVMIQCLALIPFARKAGVRYRPRFDFRGTGLSATLRAGAWTLGFVAVNQLVYVLTLRLASQGNLNPTTEGGSGSFLFALGFLISQVPHGIITVSIVTAALPQMVSTALDKDWLGFQSHFVRTLRQSFVLVLPFAVLCVVLSRPAGEALALGAASDSASQISSIIGAASLIILSFCLYFVMLRGFYAVEDTRTPFILQCIFAAVFAATAVLVSSRVEPQHVAASLLLCYGASYAAVLTASVWALSRRTGSLNDGEWIRYLVGCLASTAVMASVALLVKGVAPTGTSTGAGFAVLMAAVLSLVAYTGTVRALHLLKF